MSDDDGQDFGLVMPFVSVASNGGPWDDGAYAAGWSMGALDSLLGGHPHTRPLVHKETVRTVDVPQADLIAMRHDYRMESSESDDYPEWSFCTFRSVGGGGVS